MFKSEKGHFYYVENKFKSMDGLRDKVKTTLTKDGVSIERIKNHVFKAISERDRNYLILIQGSKCRVIYDYRTYDKTCLDAMSVCDYVYSVTTWECDKFRFRELDIERELKGFNYKGILG